MHQLNEKLDLLLSLMNFLLSTERHLSVVELNILLSLGETNPSNGRPDFLVKVKINHLEDAVAEHLNVITSALVDAFMGPVRSISHGPYQERVSVYFNVYTICLILLFQSKVNNVDFAFMDPEIHVFDVSVYVTQFMKFSDCM